MFGVGDQSAAIWSLPSGDVLAQLAVDGGVQAGHWSPDATMVVTASVHGNARVWDVETGQPLAILRHASPVYDARFSPDGKRVAIAGEDGIATIHELPAEHPSAEELQRLVRCRVPYDLAGDRLQLRHRDRAACLPTRR